MNLSIVIDDFLGIDGTLKTYRFIPINEYNKVVVDRISDIHLDVKGCTDQDVGLLRIYNSDKCQLTTTSCKIRKFICGDKGEIEFLFEHMYIPVETSERGGCGLYYFILPFQYRFTELHIVDPFDKAVDAIEKRKHFKYELHWDEKKEIQIVQMQLRSRRGSFSFIIKGKANLVVNDVPFLNCIKSDISLDQDIEDFFFDKGIKKSFWNNLKQSIIFEPNFNGIGIDIRKLIGK